MGQELIVGGHDLSITGYGHPDPVAQIKVTTACLLEDNNWILHGVDNPSSRWDPSGS